MAFGGHKLPNAFFVGNQAERRGPFAAHVIHEGTMEYGRLARHA
jgi:hypothetical protein